MSATLKSKSPQILSKKTIIALKVPKRATTKSTLEPISTSSNDFVEEIDPYLQGGFRFRRLANEAIQIEGSWLIHNRKLDESFGKTRKRLQCGDGIGHNPSVVVSSHCGFVVAESLKTVESLASCGIKPGNLPSTWLGKPESGILVSQCADISLAYLSTVRPDKGYIHRVDNGVPIVAQQSSFYIVLVRWLKGRVYILEATKPPPSTSTKTGITSEKCSPAVDDRLDPQPGYSCHMTKWNRMDPLDPSKVTLEAAFHMTQVYLYEYDEEMDLNNSPSLVVPFAVVKCRWRPSVDKLSRPCSVSDGAILLSPPIRVKKSHERVSVAATTTTAEPSLNKDNAAVDFGPPPPVSTPPQGHQRSLLATPRTTPDQTATLRIRPGLLDSPASSPTPTLSTAIPPVQRYAVVPTADRVRAVSHSSAYADKSHPRVLSTAFRPPDPVVVAGRKMQISASSGRMGIQPCAPTSGGLPRYVINCCCLMWPVSMGSEGAAKGETDAGAVSMQSWQFPVEIISYRSPGFQVYEGLLQPRFVISGLMSMSRLHYELAGLQQTPETAATNGDTSVTAAAAIDATVLDPRRSRVSDGGRPTLSPCPPLLSIDRLCEWTVPSGRESPENNRPEAMSGRFAGYRGNYFLLRLPDLTTQRNEVAKLVETLRGRQLVCCIKMPCSPNAVFCIFPDSDFSRSLGIPRLDSEESVSFHGILLLPHSIHYSLYDKCACQYAARSGSSSVDPNCPASADNQWGITLSALVSALPDSGRCLVRKAAHDRRASVQQNAPTTSSFIQVATMEPPASSQHSLAATRPANRRPYQDSPRICTPSPSNSCDMELETSCESTPAKLIKQKKMREQLNMYSSTARSPLRIPTVPPAPDIYSPHALSQENVNGVPVIPTEPQINDNFPRSTALLPTPSTIRATKPILDYYDEWRDPENQWGIPDPQHYNPMDTSNQEFRQNSEITPAVERTQASGGNDSSSSQKEARRTLLEMPQVELVPPSLTSNGALFSPTSPDGKLESPASPPREEEEGEIIDDDDCADELCNTTASSEYSTSSVSSPTRCNRIKPTTFGCSNASSISPQFNSTGTHSKRLGRDNANPVIPTKRRKQLEDVDFRVDQQRCALNSDLQRSISFGVPQTNRFKDTDYRYQVYIPKSAEAVPVPVKVINHAYNSGRQPCASTSRYNSRQRGPPSSSHSSDNDNSQSFPPRATSPNPRGRRLGRPCIRRMSEKSPRGFMPTPQIFPMAPFPVAIRRPTIMPGIYLSQPVPTSMPSGGLVRPMIGIPGIIGYHPFCRSAAIIPAYYTPVMRHSPQRGQSPSSSSGQTSPESHQTWSGSGGKADKSGRGGNM